MVIASACEDEDYGIVRCNLSSDILASIVKVGLGISKGFVRTLV